MSKHPAETDVPEQFRRTWFLLGTEAMGHLAQCRVAVFGIGGVGGHAAEALARSGIGALDLVDADKFELSNMNRQLHATLSTVGQDKVKVAAERIADINPHCRLTVHQTFYLPKVRDQFDFSNYDYVVDAIDTVTGKLSLIQQAKEQGSPIISAMGAGNKLDPAAFQVADIYETEVCPLAKIIRKECRKRGIESLKVVYSKEPPLRPLSSEVPGSIAFVPPVVGLIMAGEVVKDLCQMYRSGNHSF